MASFAERNARIDNIKPLEVVKKPNHTWKISDTLFQGDVGENISDVTNLNEAVFPGISFNFTSTLTLILENLNDMIVF